MFSMKDCSLKRSCFRSFSWRIRLWQHGEKRRSALCTTWPSLRQHTWMMRGWFRCHAIAISMPIGFNVEICADLCFVADSGTSGNQFSVCKTESIVGNRFLTLSVRIPYLLELILVRSNDRYIRSLQIIFIPRNRPCILKHSISPGNIYPHQRTISHTVPYNISTTPCHHTIPPTNIYRTNAPYHTPCHILFPPHRAIIPYYHVPCHTTQCHTAPHTIPNQKYPH